MKNRPPPEVCPVCDEDVPRNSKACPKCGACYESGWGDDYDGSESDIPDYGYQDNTEFNYEEWKDRESGKARSPGELHPIWKIAAVILALTFVIFLLIR